MKMFEEIKFESVPTVLAAWPGMGNVGLITVDYLRRKLEGKVFAEIDIRQVGPVGQQLTTFAERRSSCQGLPVLQFLKLSILKWREPV